jgi:hypothetical protein
VFANSASVLDAARAGLSIAHRVSDIARYPYVISQSSYFGEATSIIR